MQRWQNMRESFNKDSGHLPFEKLTSSAELFSSAKTLKVRSFPAHQTSAELMNPRGPAPALWSEHYSRARRGGKQKRSCQCCYASASHCTHTDHDCGSYGVTEVRATSANPARDLRRVKSGFAAIWINKHKRAGT